MRLKHIESALSSVQREFPNPNIALEQYPTSPHLTAAVVLSALEREDIGPGCTVLDLGCGTAMLSLGCALVDTDFVLGVDCDGSALEQAQLNVQQLEMEDRISLIQAKVDVPLPRDGTTQPSSRGGRGGGRMKGRGERGRGRVKHQPQAQPQQRAALPNEEDADRQDDRLSFPLLDNCVDTVVTNPPFGTKPDKAGIDVQFLKLGCRLARRAVYSFHKSSTRDFILRTASVLPNVVSAAVIAEMKFDLPRTYKFHQQASVDVEVDLIRVELIHAVNSDSSGGKADKNSSISSDEDYGTFTEG